MKRIYNNSDIQINLKTINGITDKFIIKFFTTNKEFFIRKTNENVYTVENEKYIKLNWSELQTIGDGVLNYVLNNIKDDSDYDDGEYNNTISKTTNYYICSNFKVDPETDKSISEIIAELTEKVDAEITRSANKDSEHDNAISNLNDDLEIEADARGAADLALQSNITTLQTDLDDKEFVISTALNDLNSNKAEKTELENEATARQDADNTLQSLINQLQTQIEAEETARKDADTQLQNNLVDNEFVVSAALNDLKSNKADKEELNTLQANIDKKANIGDSYTKAESDAKYLSEHQDISNLATKTELNTTQTNLTKEIEDESARARAKEITLSGQIYDIDQSLSTFEKKTDHDSDIIDLDDRVTALVANTYNKTQINNALESLEHNLQTNITTLQADLEENEFVISAALNDLNSNKAEKEELNTVQTNLTTEIENETTARQDADTQLQTNIDRKANIEDVYDKQTANSTFVTKTELQEILKKIDCGEY